MIVFVFPKLWVCITKFFYSPELNVTIVIGYTPPPGFVWGRPNEYRAASGPVDVTCMAEGGDGEAIYQWSSTCRDCPFQEIKPESNRSSIRRGATHSGDTGTHTCNVTKSGNVGSASIDFNVVGKKLH